MIILKICNRIIEYSFYALFFLVPLTFASDTYELFEFNKMWLTYGLTIIIAGSWFTKMLLQRRILLCRTPLDIPILLFLLSQIISTIFSWDMHVSVWGYYSRFNGGLLSIVAYIFLYYAFVSNLAIVSMVKRLLLVSLISGAVVALWGLPSHFGYDPTCLIFRGTLDVSCWTADFQPMVRIFSTLGQPDWLAAYLAILLPISIAFCIKNSKSEAPNPKQYQNSNDKNTKRFEHLDLGNSNLFRVSNFGFWIFLLLSALFYLDLLYTGARSGVLAAWFSLAFFFILYFWTQRKQIRKFSILILVFFAITFFVGQPFSQLNKFMLNGIKTSISSTPPKQEVTTKPHAGEFGGTDSSKIRLIVWKGAIDAWLKYPIFGTGVETFASAYYRFRPLSHNLTSEWNFLYNKAHNEYLNYLATTGAFGLGSYLLMIGWFLLLVFKKISKSEFLISNQIPSSKSQLGQLEIRSIRNLTLALLAGYLSILITNFFGFSVVITNIYLFMIPIFVFILGGMLQPKKQFIFPKSESGIVNRISLYQWTFIFFVIIASCYLLLTLFRFWIADKAYSLGYNLDRAGEYQQAYPHLQKAVDIRGGEPVFKDELAINNAILAGALLSQDDTKISTDSANFANNLAQNAISLSDFITSKYPNNVVFWKSRVRVFYSLGQIDSTFLSVSLEAIKKASELAPTDANISYNLGVLYGQNGDTKKAIEVLNNTVKLKPDYRDAYYALGLFYHEESLDKDGNVVNLDNQLKAIEQMDFILTHIASDDAAAQESLKTWENK
ncbi:MAG: hypothetical protein A3B41_01735 [Candidatus Levybacteria bacterium RIFCSPLOWO2_01_FULL_37_26]|nr:MAG: hypothetical protein A3B41_01735 [Candidatus Levybacteria bacterium RIFCSPLOWO2_01_FULL_37_26]